MEMWFDRFASMDKIKKLWWFRKNESYIIHVIMLHSVPALKLKLWKQLKICKSKITLKI